LLYYSKINFQPKYLTALVTAVPMFEPITAFVDLDTINTNTRIVDRQIKVNAEIITNILRSAKTGSTKSFEEANKIRHWNIGMKTKAIKQLTISFP